MSRIVKTGFGIDVHRFEEGRALVLGGVYIADYPGLAGHSDADVLCHAIGDAVLGAAGLGDLGIHFPDTDPNWKGAKSTGLLTAIAILARQAGHEIVNIDASLALDSPRIVPFIAEMKKNIGAALGVSDAAINIKATTAEGLGFIGRREGVAAFSVATLVKELDSGKSDSRNKRLETASEKLDLPSTVYERPPGISQHDAELGQMLRNLAEFRIDTDGASIGNPGPSGCSVVIFEPGGVPICAFSWHIGRATNNVAEYSAVLAALKWLDSLDFAVPEFEVRSDSELMVKQLNGEYKVKSDSISRLWSECSSLLRKFPKAKISYISRSLNGTADELAKRAAAQKSRK